jgi:glycosyltransferase involved in cell wall biosynthesis
MKRIRVIISTLGPLHLIKSAEYLSRVVDIRVVQAWIPSWWNKWILSIGSRISHHDLYKTFKKRVPECLNGKNIGLPLAEFYLVVCRYFHVGNPKYSYIKAATIFGMQSKKLFKDADIIHMRSGSGLGGAIERAHELGMKVVIDHSIAHPAFMDKQLRSEYAKYGVKFDLGLDTPFWEKVIENCELGDIVLVNSQFVKNTFLENGFPCEKVKVVLLGVRDDFHSLKKDYRLKCDKLRILFTGGFGFRKGAEYILRALCKLDEECFNYEFTVVGDASGAKSILEKYTPKHINLVGTIPQDDLKTYLSESDVYLFPSLCEGCASSGMEALAAGLPVIATIESGLPIEDGKNGLLISSKQVEPIIDTLKLIAKNQELREALGKSAALEISKKYTWEQYADNVLNIYKDII